MRSGSATESWMEWASEGSLDVLALADLDGDGTRDVLYTRTEHEGGATTSDWDVIAHVATGDRAVLAMHGVLDLVPQGGHPVLVLGATYEHSMSTIWRSPSTSSWRRSVSERCMRRRSCSPLRAPSCTAAT